MFANLAGRRIRAINETRPHPSHRGWRNYLAKQRFRYTYRGVHFFSAVNEHYIVFPCGTLAYETGKRGSLLMCSIREFGPELVLAHCMALREKWMRVLHPERFRR
jgi:hypothetical protein